jgi:hypothetical protein
MFKKTVSRIIYQRQRIRLGTVLIRIPYSPT